LKTPYILAISSFAVHGTASLKTFITILGEKILPVPSLLLNGLTNMSLIKKLDVPFEELLQSSFDLAVDRNLELILYIGYLGKAEQADIIIEMIYKYYRHIKIVIADPVCGDHGRAYVSDDVIAGWPKLIKLSDIVFPNMTEVKILTGNGAEGSENDEIYIEQFRQRYPGAQLVVTSVKTDDDQIGIKHFGKEEFSYSRPMLQGNYGGSGDAFLALFILNHFYKGADFSAALQTATDETWQMIKNSIDKGSDGLILTKD
jgi:pyridoxine kinase